jgi:hypothetical protein
VKLIDLTNKKFGLLTVLNRGHTNAHGDVTWNCICECGKITNIVGHSLKAQNGTRSCGCLSKKHFIDLTGQKFNELTIKRHIGKNKTNNNIYECVCNCGNVIVSEGSDVKVGKIKSCGCLKFKTTQENCAKNPFARIKKQIYNNYKNKSKKRNLPFTLTEQEFNDMLDDNCYYCGTEPLNSSIVRNLVNGVYNYRYNGIDRKVNELGYTKENAVTCCKICNIAKHNLTEEYFLEWAQKIHTHQLSKKEIK